MKCDPDEYRELLKSFNMSREKEDELILELWEIMRYFVEIGYGIDPTSKVYASLGKKIL